jgi:hypothetical protein
LKNLEKELEANTKDKGVLLTDFMGQYMVFLVGLPLRNFHSGFKEAED